MKDQRNVVWLLLLFCLGAVIAGKETPQTGASFIEQPVMVCQDPANLEPEYDLAVGPLKEISNILVETDTIQPLPMPANYHEQPSWEYLQKKYGHKFDSLEKYWPVFVREEKNIGVPAEINAAQYFLESNCGMSWLARNANNFFGIKAGHWDGRWVMYNKLPGQAGVVWREDDCYVNGKKVLCPFVKFKSPFWSFRAKSKLTHRKFKPSDDLLKLYKGREWRAWVDRLAPATDESKQYRKRKNIKNYATGDEYHEKVLKLINTFRFYHWLKEFNDGI
jgi:hypothetical protein